jgi:Fe-Mn family superoxide dismutase
MILSRRLFCRGTAAAAAAPLFGSASSPALPIAEPSGLATGKPRPLPYQELTGFLGKEQLRWHHESHYGGALKAFVALENAPAANHRNRVQKMNSVVLHELYFEGMSAARSTAGEATAAALSARFGSVARWLEDFRAAANAAAGWAVLTCHPLNRKLYDVVTDSHDDGPPWLGVPLVVIDTYEHSYYLDYQNRKGDYVDRFCTSIDWAVVEQRLRACMT